MDAELTLEKAKMTICQCEPWTNVCSKRQNQVHLKRYKSEVSGDSSSVADTVSWKQLQTTQMCTQCSIHEKDAKCHKCKNAAIVENSKRWILWHRKPIVYRYSAQQSTQSTRSIQAGHKWGSHCYQWESLWTTGKVKAWPHPHVYPSHHSPKSCSSIRGNHRRVQPTETVPKHFQWPGKLQQRVYH